MTDWTIASWNVNSIRSRLPLVLEWLHAARPDVLCVQETKSPDREFPVEPLREAGFHAAYKGDKGYNGVAIISQSEPLEVSFGLGTQKDPDEARLIAAVIDGVRVVNTYVPQGRDAQSEHFVYKLEWFDRLLTYFKKNYKSSDDLLWVGDLNVATEDKDVHDPKRLKNHVDFHPEARGKLAKVMEFGFVDVFRKHEPGEGQFTFWDYRVKNAIDRGLGWRVDHILATPSMAEKSKAAWIDPKPRRMKRPSDHTPIVVKFDLG